MSEIRKYFVSRFDDGHIMEFDFSQLEVIALAHLSQDKQLIQDIEDGVDMHRVMAAKLYFIAESAVTTKQRKTAKQLTFQLQYGAGYKSMAKSTKLPELMCKAFIANYYARYPQIKLWQQGNIELVEANRALVVGARTPKGNPYGTSTIVSETGRRYTFTEKDTGPPPWARKGVVYSPTGFYATEIKNYPVQGFATGDVVPMVLGKVYRALKAEPDNIQPYIKMINTVHDSIVFDVDAGFQGRCYDIVHPVMADVARYLHDDFGMDFTLPIKVDCQIGTNWMEMKDYVP